MEFLVDLRNRRATLEIDPFFLPLVPPHIQLQQKNQPLPHTQLLMNQPPPPFGKQPPPPQGNFIQHPQSAYFPVPPTIQGNIPSRVGSVPPNGFIMGGPPIMAPPPNMMGMPTMNPSIPTHGMPPGNLTVGKPPMVMGPNTQGNIMGGGGIPSTGGGPGGVNMGGYMGHNAQQNQPFPGPPGNLIQPPPQQQQQQQQLQQQQQQQQQPQQGLPIPGHNIGSNYFPSPSGMNIANQPNMAIPPINQLMPHHVHHHHHHHQQQQQQQSQPQMQHPLSQQQGQPQQQQMTSQSQGYHQGINNPSPYLNYGNSYNSPNMMGNFNNNPMNGSNVNHPGSGPAVNYQTAPGMINAVGGNMPQSNIDFQRPDNQNIMGGQYKPQYGSANQYEPVIYNDRNPYPNNFNNMYDGPQNFHFNQQNQQLPPEFNKYNPHQPMMQPHQQVQQSEFISNQSNFYDKPQMKSQEGIQDLNKVTSTQVGEENSKSVSSSFKKNERPLQDLTTEEEKNPKNEELTNSAASDEKKLKEQTIRNTLRSLSSIKTDKVRDNFSDRDSNTEKKDLLKDLEEKFQGHLPNRQEIKHLVNKFFKSKDPRRAHQQEKFQQQLGKDGDSEI
jgi:hypothetical protein